MVVKPPIPPKLDILTWLEHWFASQCDGDWEHSYGLEIKTLDNPGWSISIDYADTYLENQNFLTLDIHRSETDWLKCRIEGSKFRADCGPRNLTEVLTAFRHWAETQT